MASSSRASRFDFTQLTAPAVAGQATFTGCLAVVPIARRALQSRLPACLSLQAKNSEEYPCLLVFGEHVEGTAVFGGLSVPLGLRYRELMVAIPFVSWDRAAGDYLFVSGMVCDFWPAVWNGNTYWGFSKRFAPMSWDGSRLLVQNERGDVDFCGAVGGVERPFVDTLDWIQAAAGLPVLGVRRDGVFVRSRFEWDFRRANIERVLLRLTPGSGFHELPLERDPKARYSAFSVVGMDWRLTWPDTSTRST